MNLSGVSARARQLLGDPGGARFSDDLLAEAARAALAAYAQALPNLELVEVSAAQDGWRLDLSGLGDFLELQSAALAGHELRGWRAALINGAPFLLLPCGCPLSAGQTLSLTVARAHSLEGLDGAEASSPPEAHAGMLALGTAARAAAMRAALVLESPARRPEDAAALMGQAAWLGAEFRLALRAAAPGGDWLPRRGWDEGRQA